VARKIRNIEVSIAITRDSGVRAAGMTSAVPMVAATAVVKIKGPIKLASADDKLAFQGESAFVSTTVAIEWDASFRPFTKLSRSARIIPRMIRRSMAIRHGCGRYR
jgi:hypothetical protein